MLLGILSSVLIAFLLLRCSYILCPFLELLVSPPFFNITPVLNSIEVHPDLY